MAAVKLTAGSISKLSTCHRDLQRLVKELAEDGVALQVLCGHRDKVTQERAYMEGKSKLRWPRSKHNAYPSRAVDLAPFPIDWNDKPGFLLLQAKVMAKAQELGITLRWGGDWDRDGRLMETGEWDLVHFELVEPRAPAAAVSL